MRRLIKCSINFDKEIKSYFFGFLFSIILTVIPFLLVIKKFFSFDISYLSIILCSIIQIVVHFVYFLHLDFSKEQRWSIMTLLFVMIIIFIVVFGSIWIMRNLNHHMVMS